MPSDLDPISFSWLLCHFGGRPLIVQPGGRRYMGCQFETMGSYLRPCVTEIVLSLPHLTEGD
jgi:hypothetical protein